MAYRSVPIPNLEYQDFNDDGLFIHELNKKLPVLCMVRRSKCPACISAKPAFEEFAQLKLLPCVAIELDGKKESERRISKIIHKIHPEIEGVPSFILFIKGKAILHYGGRRVDDLRNFVQHHLQRRQH